MTLPRRPLPFVLCSSNHGTMIVNYKDSRMVNATAGYGVGHQLLNNACFDPSEIDMVLQLLTARRRTAGDGVVALDCGANIGVHSIEWARHMHQWGRVLAFEAQERIYYALAGNIALNNCFNAKAFHVALGERAGRLKIPQPDYNRPASFGSLELRKNSRTEYIGQNISYEDADCEQVDMMAIDDLCLARVDLLKIDVEGMELDVLAGASRAIEKYKPLMLIEQIKVDSKLLLQWLKEKGYVVHSMGINVLAIHPSDPVSTQLQVTPAQPRGPGLHPSDRLVRLRPLTSGAPTQDAHSPVPGCEGL